MAKNGTTTYRIEQLEKNYDSLDKKMDTLRTNDLPHIYTGLSSLKTRISVLTIVNVGALVLAVLVSKFL